MKTMDKRTTWKFITEVTTMIDTVTLLETVNASTVVTHKLKRFASYKTSVEQTT